ncbi:unnamed protein product [Didymodactylos carnosus]|uniref:Mab-21-like HhH/H2TH-like domain-containing protein n=1 Tax=Didymodactylos carnosus TaxID=1234261 RepID=A0A814VKR9_9BILA|nr:unnamed protein product [Didymodactylos carnosus]CAF3956330.1 unnamed protein product [Didymodactylos carnosus]
MSLHIFKSNSTPKDPTNIERLHYIATGSSAEDLYLPFTTNIQSDIDRMFEFPNMIVIDREQLLPNQFETYRQLKLGILSLEYSNKKYPCYVKLYFYSSCDHTMKKYKQLLINPENKLQITESKVESNENRKYFSPDDFLAWFERNWPSEANELIQRHGPSLCLTTANDPNLPLPMDHVPSFRCYCWPKPATSWVIRLRKSDWPNKDLIDKIVSFGCHLVVLPHPLSVDKNEWRLSFSVAEVLLAQSLNDYQKKCYLIMKAIFKVHINSDYPDTICSYYLKTIFYWFCETTRKEQFTYETLYDRFIDYADLIVECFREKYIEHYFVSNHNLIDHMDEHILMKIVDKFSEIKMNLLNIIEKCEQYYYETNRFLRFSPIIDELDKSTDDNTCIIVYYASFIQALVLQQRSIDYSLLVTSECMDRNYLAKCSDNAAKYLINAVGTLANLIADTDECSLQFLKANDIIIKICEVKLFTNNDKTYETAKKNYDEVKTKLETLNTNS